MVMSRVRTLVLAVGLVGFGGAAEAQTAADADMRLSPGDAVRLEFKDEPMLGGQLIIDGDGTALFPLLGIVKVGDRPFSTVQSELRQEYGKQLVAPVIRIVPLLRIPVLGEVREPGVFLVDPTQTLGHVIATAGGLSPTADRKKIVLLRGGRSITSRVDVNAAIPDLALQTGDQIFVGRRGWVSENAPILVGAVASVVAAAVTSIIVR
jgi:polysaccharide export outer membrane protein